MPTVIKLLCRFGVEIEVFEKIWCPVLFVAFAVSSFPPEMTPWVLQLEEAFTLSQRGDDVAMLNVFSNSFTSLVSKCSF